MHPALNPRSNPASLLPDASPLPIPVFDFVFSSLPAGLALSCWLLALTCCFFLVSSILGFLMIVFRLLLSCLHGFLLALLRAFAPLSFSLGF
jgi:hypothetical protein